jgi:(p)ppGpp synthase/HD superfamily hydrolase
MTLVARALAYAEEIHRGQKRTGKDVPYIIHPVRVAAEISRAGGSDEQVAAGLLHDVIEDHPELTSISDLATRFGINVASMVNSMTTRGNGPWRESKAAFINNLATTSNRVVLVALADKLDNLTELLADLGRDGEVVWTRFKGGREGLLWYYQRLDTAFFYRRAMLNPGLYGRFSAAVSMLLKMSNATETEMQDGRFIRG